MLGLMVCDVNMCDVGVVWWVVNVDGFLLRLSVYEFSVGCVGDMILFCVSIGCLSGRMILSFCGIGGEGGGVGWAVCVGSV